MSYLGIYDVTLMRQILKNKYYFYWMTQNIYREPTLMSLNVGSLTKKITN